jgi:hypothetical protein
MAKNKTQARPTKSAAKVPAKLQTKLTKKAVAAGAKKPVVRAVKAVLSKLGGGKKPAPKKAAPAPKVVAEAVKRTASKTAAPAKKAQPTKAAAPVKTAKATPAPKVETQKAAAPAKATKAAPGKTAKKPASMRSSAADAEQVCREVACEGLSTTAGYCRLHYIKNWKKIKRKELILKEGKLNQYIEELVAKYPDKYIEAIRQDLASDKDFAKVIYDLDLDEGIDDFEVEGESVDNLIDTIKRDFDDEGEGGF